MPDPVVPPVVPPTEPPPAAPPAVRDAAAVLAQNAELTKELKAARAAAKEAAAKAEEFAAAKAKVDKLSALARELGVDPDKADPEKERQKLEAQRAASEALATRREAAVLRSLVGYLPPGLSPRLVALAERELMNDPKVTWNPDTQAWDGLAEARAALLEDPLFSGAKPQGPGAPPPAPRLPRPGGAEGEIDQKFADVKTYADLHAKGFLALNEYQTRYPARYAQLWEAHNRRMGSVHGMPVTTPLPARSN